MAVPVPSFILGGFPVISALNTFINHQLKEYEEDSAALGRYNRAVQDAGLQDFTMNDIINELYYARKITDEEYAEALDTLKTIKTTGDEAMAGNLSYSEFINYAFQSDKDREKAHKLLDKLSTEVPNIQLSDYNTLMDYINGYSTGGANAPGNSIAYAPNPNYESTDFKGYQLDVDPVKLWTGQELADLHNIDYDVDNYYDLIKQGTTAEVDRAAFESALMNEASMVQDTTNVASYLDNIRNTKAEALSTGATAGAQAAAEVLQNKESISNYAQDQTSVANNRYNAIDDALLADAQAKMTARDYFNDLASSLGQDILTLYANDTSRFGQEWLSNSDFYRADQELRGQRAYNNASMYSNALKANSAIAGHKQQANALNDEYAWILNNALRANNYNVKKSILDAERFVHSNITNYDNRPDLYYALNNK